MSMADRVSRKGRFVFVAEAFAFLLLFLLPLKFGAIVGIPAVTMIYWRELFPLVISPWPSTLFPLFSALLLVLTLLCVPLPARCSGRGAYALLWTELAGLSPIGAFGADVVVNYPMHMIPYCFGLAAFAMAVALILENRPRFAEWIFAAVAAAGVFSLYSAVTQYFQGFEMTLEQVKQMEASYGMQFHGNLKNRLMEQRISADFSACNAYAGYLLLMIPVLLAALWKLGSRVTPPLVSRLLFTVPAFLISLFVLVKTGSRGAVLAGGVMLFASLLCLRLPRKIRYGLLALIPLGIGGFALMLALGRGVKSMIFRFDYFQAAFRMMLESPLAGTGWGGFLQHYLTMKFLVNDEAPNSPHNWILTVGSQLGVAAFLIAAALALFALFGCWRRLRGLDWKEALRDESLVWSAAAFGLAAWTFHAMMEVSFETPGSMALAIAICLALLPRKEEGDTPEKRKRGEIPKAEQTKLPESPGHPRIWKSVFLLASVVLMICAAISDLRLIRFELAFEHLNNLLDPRFAEATKRTLPPSPEEVLGALRACDEIAPDSPFQTIAVMNYFAALRDPVNEERYLELSLQRAPKLSSLFFRKYRFLRGDPSRSAEALAALETARRLSPNNPKYREVP